VDGVIGIPDRLVIDLSDQVAGTQTGIDDR
jgi:hypothetical protein